MTSHDDARLGCVITLGGGETPALHDNPSLRAAAREVLAAGGHDEALQWLQDRSAHMVLVSTGRGIDAALAFVTEAAAIASSVPVVVVSGRPNIREATACVRAGAYDYVAGELTAESMEHLLDGLTLERDDLADDARRYFCDECPPGVRIVGRSESMRRTLETIRLVSESRCNPVLILGQTGTGKELAARAVHWWRHGDFHRFTAVNCASLSAGLLESELFGHVKGAFTGADSDKVGLFEQADGGSLFLDEISEMPVELQAKLLRVLQESTFRRVGGTRDITVKVTVIASSNRNLPDEVSAGRFRQDLYYRLAVFPITIPPLGRPDRREDVGLLARYFAETSALAGPDRPRRFTDAALRRLSDYDWPGNVRELRNVVERALILERGSEITPDSLVFDPHAEQPAAESAEPVDPKDFSLETAERQFILRALKETDWQRTRAASLLGITRATLHAKLKRYDIRIPESKRRSGGKSASGRKRSAKVGEQSG